MVKKKQTKNLIDSFDLLLLFHFIIAYNITLLASILIKVDRLSGMTSN